MLAFVMKEGGPGLDRDRPPDANALANRIRLAADVVLDGMRKRNERVRVAARAPGATWMLLFTRPTTHSKRAL